MKVGCKDGIDKYSKRLKHYISFEFVIIPDLKNRKNLSEIQQKEQEGKLILKQVHNTDTLIFARLKKAKSLIQVFF